MKTAKIAEIKEAIKNCSATSKIYIGCDSKRQTKKGKFKQIKFSSVVVIHIDSKHGADVIGFITETHDLDYGKGHRNRLLAEAYNVSELYNEIKDSIGNRPVEIHLDINSSEEFLSNIVMKEAVGIVKSLTMLDAKTKPDSFASSFAADRLLHE